MRCVAVASGKGGVGKTSVAVNLSVALRMLGRSVLLMDADMGLGNVDVLLGLRVLSATMRDVVLGDAPLTDAVVKGPAGIEILRGASGVVELAELPRERLEAFFEAVASYTCDKDFLVVDTSPGIDRTVTSFVLAADEVLLVTGPEPAALTDAYALLKVVSRGLADRGVPVGLVVNRVRDLDEGRAVYARLRDAVRRFLRFDVNYAGAVRLDEVVERAAREQCSFVFRYPASVAAVDLTRIAARIAGTGEVSAGSFFERVMENVGEGGESG